MSLTVQCTEYGEDYLLARRSSGRLLQNHVKNSMKLIRKAQLENYDGCARIRHVWDEIASIYDAVITPGAVDEAPLIKENTGDAVRFLVSFLAHYCD